MSGKWDIDISWITGLMLGLEFPALMEIMEDVEFAAVIDLFIVRIAFVRWKVVEQE
jgi:hypothetical protein